MRSSSSIDRPRAIRMILGTAAGLFATAGTVLAITASLLARQGVAGNATAGRRDLLINGGFEQHKGVGTIPAGWQALDENLEFFGWVAPRVERSIGGVGPRTGRYMIGLATDMMGVDTNDRQYRLPRSAIFQTLTVPGGTRGTFSVYYNDLGSTALSHVSAIRLAYTIDNAEISTIKFPKELGSKPAAPGTGPGLWSKPYFRVSQKLPSTQAAVGDWSLAAIPILVETDAPEARLTLWIGIFDHQNSTELGYYRIDDASFVIDRGPPCSSSAPHR